MAFKIAYGAGHYLKTIGKRIPKCLDPNQTREWVLNDRVARYFAEAAAEYEGVELLRVDDPEGEKNISIQERCRAANSWGADFCLAIHHNAAGKKFNGGGVVAYIYKNAGIKTKGYQKAIYEEVVAAGDLKGNRANPLEASNLYVTKNTVAPCVLIEYGFMDSTVDAPIILTDAYAKKVAYATMDGIAKVAGLKKKGKTCTVQARVLQKGANGYEVKVLQNMLLMNGHSCGSTGADGDFGSATDKALKEYQKAKGLVEDGIAGANTWNSLLGLK